MIFSIFAVQFLITVLCVSHKLITAGDLGTSLMRQMWMTPIQMYSLANTDESGLSNPVLNTGMLSLTQAEVMAHFEYFKEPDFVCQCSLD